MDKKRNLLLVMTDHQRYDTIFMRQCGREVTPNLNRLAEQGTLYERAYTACPLCVPARTALATGIYPTQTGVVYNDWEDRTAVSAETMHDLLKQAGYRVGHVGVDHIRVNPPMRERGYDYFSSQAEYEDYAKKQGYILKEPEDIRYVMEACDGKLCSEGYSGTRTSIWNHPLEEFKDYFFLKQAEEFLASQEDDRPFALFVYLWAPHPPLRVPEPFASMYPPSRISLPDNIGIPAENEPASRRRGAAAQLAEGVSDEEWRQVWASYLGLVSLADDIVGKLLSSLEISGKSEDTVVVFTADHGDNLGQHSMYQKMEMYESCIRIPLTIREPGQEHERVGKLVSHLDLMPTVCSLAGIDGSRYEGISLLGRGGEKRRKSQWGMTVYRDHGRKRGDSMDKLNSRVFYKMYLTNTVLMVVFVGILALISSHFSSKFVLDKITDFNRQTIEDRGEVLEDKLRQMNDLSDAAVASDEVIRLMLTEKDQYISPLVMQEIIQDLKIIRDNYTLVDEISLVDYEREMVINSQSKLSLRETIYRDAIDWEPLSFHSDSGGVSILYTKNWRPVQREADFSIVLEINQEAFQENLFIPFEDLREYVVTGDGAILSEAGLVEELQDGWEQIEGEEYGNAAAGLTAYVHQINGGGGSVAGVWDNAQLRKEAGRIVYKIIGICVAIIAIASLILYFSALSFYKPLRKLKERVSEMKPAGKGEVGRNPDKKENNEFQFIESAIHSLQDEKQQIKEKYEESVPVITQNVSSRLITEGYEEEAFSHLLGVLGYEMRGSQYVLLIAECKNRGEIHALGERLNELIRKDGMEALYFEKNVGQGTFLINTDLPYKNFIEQVEIWKQETSKVVSTWCLSDYFANRSNMNLVYWETVERLKKKFFKEENAIIYGTSAKEEKEGQVSNIKIEQKLLACIKEGKDGESEEILHDFTRELSNTQLEIQYTVFIYFSICSKLIQDLKSFDVALSKEYDEKAVFQELFQGENIYDLEKTTLKVIRTLAEKFQEKEPVHSASVKKAIEFIEENYHRDLTLEDIANEVYLTTIYLSNLFKKETGCTVMEYVTRLRMKEARELLSQSPAIKIKDIAERLGYRNVQSFIRYFKIYYGVTPVEFRRNRKHETHGGKDDQ